MTAFDLQGISASYGGRPVLESLSLTVQPGEKVALVGRSGAGKSTLLGLLHERSGPNTALLPQEPGLVPLLSVFHNVYMGKLSAHSAWYNLANLVRPLRRELTAISNLLEQLALAEKLREPVGTLSGGQKQRVAVARALYQNADTLLADEPVSALDVARADLVMKALTQAARTAVIAMHDIELALRYCDRVVGLDDGRIVLDQASERLQVKDLLPLY